MPDLLTPLELEEFTDAKQAKKQMSVLAKHGIKFIQSAKGNVKTTWTAVNSALTNQDDKDQDQPNLGWLKNG